MPNVLNTLLKTIKNKRWLCTVIGICVIVIVSSWTFLGKNNTSFIASNAEVVIIDQLDGSYPNQTFKSTVTELMDTFDLDVDYYQHDEITVDFFYEINTSLLFCVSMLQLEKLLDNHHF
jgi:hypothetical protein